MSRWIKLQAPPWSGEPFESLIATLATAFSMKGGIIEIWEAAGLDVADLNPDGTPRQVWIAAVKYAHKVGKLEAIIELVKTRAPATDVRLDVVLAAEVAGAAWYDSADRFGSRLLGPGRSRTLLDRSGLSWRLRDIARNGYKVLNIRGEPGAGKSHSGYLIQHVAADPTLECEFRWLDVATMWPVDEWPQGVGAHEFIRVLALKVGIEDRFEVDSNTGANRVSRELAELFAMLFRRLQPRRRWVFIDGLDEPVLHADVHKVVGHLAVQADEDQLHETHLILTGYPPEHFAPKLLDVLLEEEIEQITELHLHGFFDQIAADVGRAITPKQEDELVARVLQQASLEDLARLGRTAGDVARDWFGP